MYREIHSAEQLTEQLRCGTLARCVLQGLDLRDVDLGDVDVDGAALLGCRLPMGAAADLLTRGALLFPALPELPYNPYRPRLYSAPELMNGYRRGEPATFNASLDQRIFAHCTASWSAR